MASKKVLSGTKSLTLSETKGLTESALLASGYLLPTGYKWGGFSALGKPQISPYVTQYAGVEQDASNSIKGDTDNAYSLKSFDATAEAYSYGIFNVTSDFSSFSSSNYYGYKPADANAVAIADTYLVTGKLKDFSLTAKAIANVGADWAWGSKDFYLDATKNKYGISGAINVYGECGSGVSVDPVFGINKSTFEFSKSDDVLSIKASANAGDFSNEAVAYGIQGGHLDADKLDKDLSTAGFKNLRYAVDTGGGDDQVNIEVEANNFGLDSAKLIDSKDAQSSKVIKSYLEDNEDKGMQRAVGVFRSVIDLGTGSDSFTSNSNVSLNFNQDQARDDSNILLGATLIGSKDDLFEEEGGRFSGKVWKAAAAVDIFESVLLAGSGNDKINIYNGWFSDIWLEEGDDTLELSAGRDLYIHGGEGNDTVKVSDNNSVKQLHGGLFKEAKYEGFKNGFHEVMTSEGSIYIDDEVENLIVNGQAVEPPLDVGINPPGLIIELSSAIRGGKKNDKLKGNSKKDDVIVSGAGKDKMTGKSGVDTFVLTDIDETDTITDFNPKYDKIVFADGVLDGYDSESSIGILTTKELNELADAEKLNEETDYIAIGKTKQLLTLDPDLGVNLGINTSNRKLIFDEDGDWSTTNDQQVLLSFSKKPKTKGWSSASIAFGAILKP